VYLSAALWLAVNPLNLLSPASSLRLGIDDAHPVQWQIGAQSADLAAVAGEGSVISRVSSLENWTLL